MNNWARVAICASVLLGAVTPTAQAAVINVSFTAQNFTSTLGGGIPQDPISGSFSLQHDSAADFTGAALNPSLFSIDLTIDGYTYSLANTEMNAYLLLNNGLVEFVQLGEA